jgi:predicted nucleic acid-binding protein
MKLTLISLAIATVLVACSSIKPETGLDAGQITPINAQKLATNFTRKGIKIEWNCNFPTGILGSACSKGDIKSIEVTAYAPSYGNSEVNRENAFNVATMNAKAKLRRFINEDISTTEVKTVLTKNVEKANDRIKNRINADTEVAMSDTDTDKETNWAVRENANDTVQSLTENIRVQAQGILRGVYAVDERVVDRQTVQVTIRWDQDSDKASLSLRKKFQ